MNRHLASLLLCALVVAACDSKEDTEGTGGTATDGIETDGTETDAAEATGGTEEVHPLCAANFEVQPEFGGAISALARPTCGTYTGGDSPTGGPGCLLEGIDAGMTVSIEADIEIKTTFRGRVLHVEGDLAIDQKTEFAGGSSSWEELRVVETPDLDPCGDEDGHEAAWSCIENAFDGATVVTTCWEAGGYFFPE